MGLLKGLLREGKLLLSLSVPFLLLPLPLLHPSSVSTGLSPPGDTGSGGRSRRGGGWRAGVLMLFPEVLLCGFEDMEAFSWGGGGG